MTVEPDDTSALADQATESMLSPQSDPDTGPPRDGLQDTISLAECAPVTVMPLGDTRDTAPLQESAPQPPPESGPEAISRLLRGLPRAVQQSQVAGFLAVTRAHPTLSAARDYAGRKHQQAERAEQRVEAQLWGRVGQALADLPSATDRGGRGEAQVVQTFAQHLSAENLWRLAQMEAAARGPARRGPGERPAPARAGGQRG